MITQKHLSRYTMRLASCLALSGLLLQATPVMAQEVEITHWYTSSSEAAALAVVKKEVEARGVTWQDAPVAGGAGDAAMVALRARVQAGDPPGAVQFLGHNITAWAESGVLLNLDDLAERENWEAAIPEELKTFSKYDGHYVAAPLGTQRQNWVFFNMKLMEQVGGTLPQTFEDLIALGKKFQQAGVVALAIGSNPWQQGLVFDNIVLSIGGSDFYRKAFVELDAQALGSDIMIKAFDQLRQLRNLADDDFTNRDWNLATAMVIQGRAGMQIVMDSAKGEFTSANQKLGEDIGCIAYPGTNNKFIFLTDQFAMFDHAKAGRAAQEVLASAVMNPNIQAQYSLLKGAVPARIDVAVDGIDVCGQNALDERMRAIADDNFLPSMAFIHAAEPGVVGAYLDVITNFFNSDISSAEATAQLVNAVANAQ